MIALFLGFCVFAGVGVERSLHLMFGWRVDPKRKFLEDKRTAELKIGRLHEYEQAGLFDPVRVKHLSERIAMQELFGVPKPRGPRGAYQHRQPAKPPQEPPALWTADFKGHFRLGTGGYCYPLTVIDGYSRYLLACRGLEAIATATTRSVFEGIFRTYGLPDRIRTDNGPPFATCALGRLSALSVWWIKLGIRPELIQPAHPEQNGRHERLHRTLKAEATRPAAATARGQQRRFDHFQREYNQERLKRLPRSRPRNTTSLPRVRMRERCGRPSIRATTRRAMSARTAGSAGTIAG